jgi:hypothetical protein
MGNGRQPAESARKSPGPSAKHHGAKLVEIKRWSPGASALGIGCKSFIIKMPSQVAIEDVIEVRYDLEATVHMPLLVRLRTVLSKDKRHRHKAAGVGRRADISICEN